MIYLREMICSVVGLKVRVSMKGRSRKGQGHFSWLSSKSLVAPKPQETFLRI